MAAAVAQKSIIIIELQVVIFHNFITDDMLIIVCLSMIIDEAGS